MEKEFQRICVESSSDLCNAISRCKEAEEVYRTATAPYNLHKNRYKDVLPLGFAGGVPTRVFLQPIYGMPGSDYVNANFIDAGQSNQYIASQAPVPHTIGDFWRMIWEQESTVVVMLTKLIENDRIKAHSYWPALGKTHNYGFFSVACQQEECQTGVVVRLFQVMRLEDGASRLVTQLHFCDWPDSGAPMTCESTIKLIQLTRVAKKMHEQKQGLCGPVVVHCSAGIGRAGTFIAIDMMLDRMFDPLANEDTFPKSVYECVRWLRQRRKGMVQSLDQYKFIFKVLDEISKMHPQIISEETVEASASFVICQC